MEPAKVVPLHAISRAPMVSIDGERVVIERLVLNDRALADFVASRSPESRPELVERGLRIGLLALQDSGTTLDVDLVRREFGTLLERSQRVNERAAEALANELRANFGDGEGRLPRTLERFLGDRGQLRSFVNELFDETKRDSAVGRLRQMLSTYFDGDSSRLATLLDPTRLGSPLHQFRSEMTESFAKLNERLTAVEAAASARAEKRARSAAKGADFEDLLDELLADVVRTSGDVVDRTMTQAGDVIRSRKGDFLLTVDPALTHGAPLRVVIESKDRKVSTREIRDELEQARVNRGAAVALAVFTPQHAPTGVAPFDVRGGDVYCVIDPQAPDHRVLEAALRLARLLALATLDEHALEIDPQVVAQALSAIRNELELVRRLKAQLTSIGTAAQEVGSGLDVLRARVLARVSEAEAELRATA